MHTKSKLEIVAFKLKSISDMIMLTREIDDQKIVVLSLSAIKEDVNLLKEILRRLKILAQKRNLGLLGLGMQYLIIAPKHVRIRFYKVNEDKKRTKIDKDSHSHD